MGKSGKKVTVKRIVLFVSGAILLVAAGLLLYYEMGNSGVSGSSVPDGYISRYHPGHISSSEAWTLANSEGGAAILDVRPEESYDERHVSGAVNVPFETLTAYAKKNLPDKNRVIICYCFCGDMGGTALAACNQLTELGYSNVYYAEPEDEWAYEGTLTESSKPGHGIINGVKAKEIYDSTPGTILLDVRTSDEFEEKHIDRSVLIPLAELESRLSELPRESVIIVYCKGGTRSRLAIEILSAAGYVDVYDMQKIDQWPEPLITR